MSETPAIYRTRPVTSASNLFRRKLCPGSAKLEADAPEETSEEANEGSMLHDQMTLLPSVGKTCLNPDQQWCINFCRGEAARLVAKVFGVNKPKFHMEQALDFGGVQGFGHADFIAFHGGVGLVIDYKFGRREVQPAEANMQLRAYALMVAQANFCTEVYAAIIQPRADDDQNRVRIVQYSDTDLEQAGAEIEAILKSDNDDLKPGLEQCHYCRARSFCPALKAQSTELQKATVDGLTLSNAAELYRYCKIVERHIDALKQKIYLLAVEAEACNLQIPGIKLKPGTERRAVNDPQKAFEALSSVLSPSGFIEACTVKIGALEFAYKEASGLKGQKAKEEMNGKLELAGCLEMKRSAPSLELIETVRS